MGSGSRKGIRDKKTPKLQNRRIADGMDLGTRQKPSQGARLQVEGVSRQGPLGARAVLLEDH